VACRIHHTPDLRWLRGEVEEHLGEVEEEAEQICPICYDAVNDSESCHFACCMQKSFHIACVQHANISSLVVCLDCGTTPDTTLADPDVMAEGMTATAIATEFQSIVAELVRHRASTVASGVVAVARAAATHGLGGGTDLARVQLKGREKVKWLERSP
jgi:hypothetical protein